MALLFSAVRITAGDDEVEFLVGGIPRELDDLEGWSAFDDFTENITEETEIEVHACEMPQVQAGGTAEPRLFQENIQKPRANQPISYREYSQIIRSEWRHKSESDSERYRK